MTTHETIPARFANGAATDRPGGKVARLAAEARDAAQVRALTTDRDVIALRVEKVRAQVDGLLWAGIVLGLAFTMVNVQTFAAAGSPTWSAGWWVAWLLDPMVSLVLLAVLRAEQVTARYQVALPAWGRRTKWLTFAATYVMNTWTSWGLGHAPFSASGVVLHSVPPLVVFATAETGPGLRDRLTEAVHRALTEHTLPASTGATSAPVHEPVTAVLPGADERPNPGAVREPAPAPVHEPAREHPQARRSRRKPTPRRLLGDYLAQARAELDRARSAGAVVDPTPGWCRQVTGCSAGTSVKLAAALRANTSTVPAELVPIDASPSVSVSGDRQEAA
ncbi:uroporphyrinogen-III C-methyltransferase [Pseudonocardia acidicola]|uniref:uroporphyrinogen-III C-methyltransferase n=1 Tax=Pseudonocardia acidicola TaxID=2724939 RepID=UPI001EF0FBFD|nr:uroporphyrinogen-III C-methyltransferase [Pseudonocardia acidicola]